MTDYSAVGHSVARVDALDKVTGRAQYTIDKQLTFPRLLYGKILGSPYPHARILSIDTSRAERLPGVVAVVTGKDAPGRFGYCYFDQYIPARGEVRFVGETVAAVAAKSPEIAAEATELIEIKYEELPAVSDVEEAFLPEPLTILHPGLSKYDKPYLSIIGPISTDLENRPNVNSHFKIRKGNVERGFEEAELIIENRFSTAKIMPSQLEPNNCIARVESDGSLTVWSSSNAHTRVRGILSQAFNMPTSKVRLISSYIGGAFGGFPKVEQIASVLAFKTQGRPVSLTLSREEIYNTTCPRANSVIYLKDGVMKDGTLVAREMKVLIDCGAYAELGPLVVKQSGIAAASLYKVPHCQIDTYGVYTNTLITGPMRGVGFSQTNWAIERQTDITARKLGMDAVELRRKNLLREGDKNIMGEAMHSLIATECLDRAAKWIGWGEPSEPRGSHWRRGKGIALGNKMTLIGTSSGAVVKVHGDGALQLYVTVDEIGQGVYSILGQVVAEEFGTPINSIKIFQGDTAITPYDYGSIASRTTYHTGNAVRRACQDAKRQLFDLAASRLRVSADALEISGGEVYVKGMPSKSITIAELLLPLPGEEITGQGSFGQPAPAYDWETGQGERMAASYGEGAQAVEVALDVETGEVKILRVCSVFNMGQPINPKLCQGQMEGGMLMGIGNALYEELVMEKGKVLTPGFSYYRVPSIKQMPSVENIKSMIQVAPHSEGPYGAKGLGEGVMLPTAAAIASAISNAVGVDMKDLPMTAPKLLKAIKAAGRRDS